MSDMPGFNRRRFFGFAAATGVAGPLSLLDLNRRPKVMTEATATEQTGSDKAAIRPFPVPTVSDADLADLRKRINATKWPDPEYVPDATQGVQFATTRKLARYWGTNYDWRKCEARLKSLPHFITEIDGLDIHFIHVRSKHENALPMIVTPVGPAPSSSSSRSSIP